jgi:hypothetical protein
MDTKQVKQIADTEAKKMVQGHEKQMHSSKGIGLLKAGAVKMAKGGKTNDMMKQYGRGMAKVVNQRGSARGK